MKSAKHLVLLLPVLAGCSETTSNHMVSGAEMGASNDMVIGTATGGSPLNNTLIGGIGAVGDTAAMPDQVNLDQPVWK